jgi:hypothetical protein
VIALLALLAVLVTAVLTDSVGTIIILNRVVRLQHDVCDIHAKVRAWEEIASRQLHVHGPLLGPETGCPR